MSTARGELIQELEALRAKLGSPSLRSIAMASGCSHTTVAKLLSENDPLPSWPRVESIALYLEGNVNHIRHMWLDARREAGMTDSAAVLPATGDPRHSLGYDGVLYALTLLMIITITIGGAVSHEVGWLLSVSVQLVTYLAAAVLAVSRRKLHQPDMRAPMRWFAASAASTATAEALQLLAPHMTGVSVLIVLSDILYLAARVLLIVFITHYLRNRSTVAITPWVRIGIAWTPLIWLCASSLCFLLMSDHLRSFAKVIIVQLVVNAFYLTLDIQLAVVAVVVITKYAPKRGPFFLVLLLATALLVSDIAWNLLGPTAGPTSFTMGIGYVAAGALMLALSVSPDLRVTPTRHSSAPQRVEKKAS